ncbi:MAG: 2-pyrone-4,6-dicarboxylate lactonase [Alphaproteobacteria bacterium]|jgi:2-pyrone-4,6-dicarboxylate lactonase
MSAVIPFCPGPDPEPTKPVFEVPAGAIDTHAHVFGPEAKYPYSPARGYTPPDAPLSAYNRLHKVLGIDKGVLTQPSVYGIDNSAILDAVAASGDRLLAVAALGEDVTDKELEGFHGRRVRGVRVNLVDKGGMPFDGIGAVQKFTERIRDFGWHLEVLIHAHEFENLRETFSGMAVDVVVGHLGYMKTEHGIDNPGFQELLASVRDGKCWVKFSGSYRITGEGTLPYRDVTPFAEALVKANSDRIIWGSDWPHPTFYGTMPNDGLLFDQLADWVADEALRRKILVDNPRALYGAF